MKRHVVRTLAAVSLVAVAACESPWGPALNQPAIAGQITSVTPAARPPVVRFNVVQSPAGPAGPLGFAALVGVGENTVLIDASGATVPNSRLVVGAHVAVAWHGVVLESDPPQIGADTIVVY